MRTETACKPRVALHPAEHQLQSFMRAELPLVEVKPIVRHMLAGCVECRKVTRPLWERMERKPERLGDVR